MLRSAARSASSSGAWRSRSASLFLADLEVNVLALRRSLADGSWRPGTMNTFRIRDPKPRVISSSPFPDRVVHHALIAVIGPCLQRGADPDSFACRTGAGPHAAVRRAQDLVRANGWFGKLDVRHYFETAPHAGLLDRLSQRISDERILRLVARILAAGSTDRGRGLPIGSLTSQHLGNFYLGRLDEVLVAAGIPHLRYMDDVLVFAATKGAAGLALALGEQVVEDSLGLVIKQEARRKAPVHTGVPFLGFRIWPGLIRLDSARVRRFRRGVRRVLRAPELDETARSRSVAARFAWARVADTYRLRTSFLLRLARDGLEGAGAPWDASLGKKA